MDLQLGVLPEMDREAPGLFTASERIIQDFACEKMVDATFIKDLIQKVLHHPDFDPDDVDHDMHERLMAAIEEGDLEVCLHKYQQGSAPHGSIPISNGTHHDNSRTQRYLRQGR